MCGAFSVIHPFKEIGRRFNAGYNKVELPPRYNARPTQQLPIILKRDTELQNGLVTASWGLTPAFMKGGIIFNVRKESLDTKRFFTSLFAGKRCLVPADGFYEWSHIGKTKQPYRFTVGGGELFAFAGLYDTGPDHATQFAIITLNPNPLVARVHNRMPAILPRELEQAWLNHDGTPDELLSMLAPYPDAVMHAIPVSTAVNSSKNDSPEIIRPIDE